MLTFRVARRAALLLPTNNINIVVVEKYDKSVLNIPPVASNFYSTRGGLLNQVRETESLKMTELTNLPLPRSSFKFTQYDCLGFDLDNTICRYKLSNMVKMEYKCLADYLINEKNYSDVYLRRPIEENVDFLLKGLILDVKKGNILRIAPDGLILHASHGTRELTNEELTKYYGPEAKWDVTNAFIENPLQTWNGPMSDNMRTLLDYFDMPAGLAFARAVDTLDEENGGPLNEYNIYPHIFEALQNMFNREHFQLNKGGYFPSMTSDPDNYIHKCSPDLMNWLRSLKERKKILFLITGSDADFASYTASKSMGKNWQDLFDIIICFAKKPGFFTGERPFTLLNGFTEDCQTEDLERGRMYTYGNWNGLHQFLKKATNKDNPKIVYMGDNLIQDIYTPSVHTVCDTVAVCEELEAEGVFGHERVHMDENLLVSNRWGSYFHHRENTIWKDIILKHAKLCIPSLEFVARNNIDYDYWPQ